MADSEKELRDQLKSLSEVLQMSSSALLPNAPQELLSSIVEAAATIFGAQAASIALIRDGETLEFVTAYGVGGDEIIGRRIPVDRGIAGFVALTGQALAISDVEKDPRFDREFAASTGYVPNSILAAPLERRGSIVGVMEVLDKLNAPGFAMQDLELMGIFGRQAAIAIGHTEMLDQLGEFLRAGLLELAASEGTLRIDELVDALQVDSRSEASEELREMAHHIARLYAAGEAERKACLGVLHSLTQYLDHRRTLS